MRSDRVARALLCLYPRAWRQRYGDEFLALIADAGLSWREAVDVIGAAGVERLRAFVFLVRSELDPDEPPSQYTTVRFADGLRELALFATMVVVTVVVLAAFGVQLPRWKSFYWIYILGSGDLVLTTRPLSNWRDRALRSYFWFAAAVGTAGVCWFVAWGLGWFGAPQLSDRAFFSFVGVFFLSLLLRGIYGMIRTMIYGSTWRGMHPYEILAWRMGMLSIVLATANVDPAGEVFWTMSLVVGMSFKTPYELTRHGAARRRALFEQAEETWMFQKTDRS